MTQSAGAGEEETEEEWMLINSSQGLEEDLLEERTIKPGLGRARRPKETA